MGWRWERDKGVGHGGPPVPHVGVWALFHRWEEAGERLSAVLRHGWFYVLDKPLSCHCRELRTEVFMKRLVVVQERRDRSQN